MWFLRSLRPIQCANVRKIALCTIWCHIEPCYNTATKVMYCWRLRRVVFVAWKFFAKMCLIVSSYMTFYATNFEICIRNTIQNTLKHRYSNSPNLFVSWKGHLTWYKWYIIHYWPWVRNILCFRQMWISFSSKYSVEREAFCCACRKFCFEYILNRSPSLLEDDDRQSEESYIFSDYLHNHFKNDNLC